MIDICYNMFGDTMRLRYVKGAKELIANHPLLIIDNINNTYIDFQARFKNDNPIHIEIGMGKGRFIYELAKSFPGINYIGIERFDSVIVRALEKVIENPLPNLQLLRSDALNLKDVFKKNSISRIYLNFSDPWPKDRHHKRRLTNKKFLDIYKEIVTSNSEIHFKTDNNDLFGFSLKEMVEYPMNILFVSKDLHNSDFEGNIMTEFEEKFSNLGNKISKLTATFKEE